MSNKINTRISVVTAAYNEEDNIRQLVQEIDNALKGYNDSSEIIVVNDGSRDGTLDVCRDLLKQYACLRVISLKRRYGQTAAIDAGFKSASGEFVAMLDADLQNDPADIPSLVDILIEKECDLVNGWRFERKDKAIRRISTKIANYVRNWLTNEIIHDSACGIKVFRRDCLKNIKLFAGMHRFLPTLFRMEGFNVVEVRVNHRPRTAGQAKYGVMNRVFKALRDTFAVRWMQRRTLRYEKEEILAD